MCGPHAPGQLYFLLMRQKAMSERQEGGRRRATIVSCGWEAFTGFLWQTLNNDAEPVEM
jgi:hypothetical protein